jgi:hypothetical protein
VRVRGLVEFAEGAELGDAFGAELLGPGVFFSPGPVFRNDL